METEHHHVEHEAALDSLLVASAKASRLQAEAIERGDIDAAVAAAYRAGRIDEARRHLDPTDLDQMQRIADQWREQTSST